MTTKTYEEILAEVEKLREENIRLKRRKKYGLVWEDKEELFDTQSQNALPVLVEKGGNFKDVISDKNDDFNILIEGDNYHSLSVLNYTHKNKIDLIYIDPPYNTGNKDFIYNDKIIDKEDDFRHSKWLSFMDKRLRLAKSLLKDNGVIFISIDDNELYNIQLLLSEIFGEDNCELMIWDKVTGNDSAGSGKMKITHRFRKDHEYILCVYKDKQKTHFIKPLGVKEFKNEYGNTDNDPRGNWMSCEICKSEKKSIKGGKNYFTFVTPFDKEITRQWHYSEKELQNLMSDNRIYFGNGNIIPRLKKFLNEKQSITPTSVLQRIASTTDGNNDAKFLDIAFDNPKPIKLTNYLINLVLGSNDNKIVLDFFAGSGTTGHAILDLNNEDGGNRKFILCTNNENNICEDVTWKRIKRVSQGYKNSKSEKFSGLGGNIKYLKTDFVDKQIENKITDEDKINLTYEVGTLLALKENTFNQKEKNKYYQIFEGKNKITAIYFRENKEKLDELLQKVSKEDKQIKLYIFSWEKGSYKNSFEEYENVTSEDIPEPILEIYKNIGL